ncbi:putative ribonuclease H-like domain-containing protein [Tanacetum coccineum]
MVNTVKGKNVNTARPKAVVNTAKPKAVLNAVKGNQVNAVKASACWVWKPKTKGNPQMDLQDQGVIDSGCSRHMIGNMSYLTDSEEISEGYVAFGGNPKGGKITGRGTIKTGNLDFENVYFLTDESHVLLKFPRKNNMYSVDLKNIVPKGGLTCLFAKATSDESKLWHQWLGHINFKTMNKLVKEKLISKPQGDNEKKVTEEPEKESGDSSNDKEKEDDNVNSTNNVNTACDGNNTNNVNAVSSTVNAQARILYSKEQTIKTFKIACLLAFYHKKNPKRIEAIRLFLAYASFKDFVVYQMDVKSAFLYGKIEEEVYVCQPPGFEDPNFPDRVYKRGKIDKTLFIRRDKYDILLVQVYVDDIIFGSTKKSLCTEFEKMMHKKFQMSSMASTPMETQKHLLKDEDGEEMDVYLYRSMIGSLMYLTSSRHDIMFAVCACERYQYPKDTPFDLVAYTDSDYARARLDRKSTTGGCQFFGCRLISWQCKKQTVVANSITEAEYVAALSCCGQVLWIQN